MITFIIIIIIIIFIIIIIVIIISISVISRSIILNHKCSHPCLFEDSCVQPYDTSQNITDHKLLAP